MLVAFGFGQKRLLDEPAAGLMHVLIFAAFMVLAIREIQLFGMGFSEGFELPLLGAKEPLGRLYGLACNLVAVGGCVGVAMAWANRVFRSRTD